MTPEQVNLAVTREPGSQATVPFVIPRVSEVAGPPNRPWSRVPGSAHSAELLSSTPSSSLCGVPAPWEKPELRRPLTYTTQAPMRPEGTDALVLSPAGQHCILPCEMHLELILCGPKHPAQFPRSVLHATLPHPRLLGPWAQRKRQPWVSGGVVGDWTLLVGNVEQS